MRSRFRRGQIVFLSKMTIAERRRDTIMSEGPKEHFRLNNTHIIVLDIINEIDEDGHNIQFLHVFSVKGLAYILAVYAETRV